MSEPNFYCPDKSTIKNIIENEFYTDSKGSRHGKALDVKSSNLTVEAKILKKILDDRLNTITIKAKKCVSFNNNSTKNSKNWKKSSLYMTNTNNDKSLDIMNFYVGFLAPLIVPSNIHIGDKIFNMSSIPGREKSMIWNTNLKNEGPDLIENLNGQNDGLSYSPNQETSFIQENFEDKSNVSLIQSNNKDNYCRFSSMFNSYIYSDLFIILKSGGILYLHKFVLAAWKCNYDNLKESQYYVSIEDDIVIKTFKHLYSDGQFPIDDIVDSDDCKSLCQKFGIDHKLLRKYLSHDSSPSPSGSNYIFNRDPSPCNISPVMKYNNEIVSKREIFHSTPHCQIFKSVESPIMAETNPNNDCSDTDLFGSFSQDISISMNVTKENSQFFNREASSSSPNREIENVSEEFNYEPVIIFEENQPIERRYYSPKQSPVNSITYDDPPTPLPLFKRLNLHMNEDNIIIESLPKVSLASKLSLSDSQKSLKRNSQTRSETESSNGYTFTHQTKTDNLVLSGFLSDEELKSVTKPKMRKSLSDCGQQKKPMKRLSTEKNNQPVSITEPKTKKKKIDKKSMKTPPKQKFTFNPFTPMPDYDNMPTPELQRYREKYGLKKTLPKKTVVYLKECHRLTHRVDDGLDTSSSDDDSPDDVVMVPDDDGEEVGAQLEAEKMEHLFNFLKVNYFYDILTYKTLNVVKIINDLKQVNVKQDLKKLYDFLDYHCISYKKIDDPLKKNKFTKPKKTKKFVI